ncbi:hypothetical protein G7046_g9181 [Stylonectria norvegica]|nr:hypothetical protein G7046_g9181 [Stylonectria norvegica]
MQHSRNSVDHFATQPAKCIFGSKFRDLCTLPLGLDTCGKEGGLRAYFETEGLIHPQLLIFPPTTNTAAPSTRDYVPPVATLHTLEPMTGPLESPKLPPPIANAPVPHLSGAEATPQPHSPSSHGSLMRDADPYDFLPICWCISKSAHKTEIV